VCARAVRHAFFRLFRDGLIFQGSRLVNWDCELQTAVADDELYRATVHGHFYYLRYPVLDPQAGEPTHVTVATTRPETMLGDTAVAVHPNPRAALDLAIACAKRKLDEVPAKERAEAEADLDRLLRREFEVLPTLVRLAEMAHAGRKVQLPLQDKPIPIIVDEWAKPDVGSGCVKITPAHDPNDYAVWQRHKGEFGAVCILEPDGTLGNTVPAAFRGLDRFAARRAVVDELRRLSLLESIEDREIEVDTRTAASRSSSPCSANSGSCTWPTSRAASCSDAVHGTNIERPASPRRRWTQPVRSTDLPPDDG
jgi:valyl-tRNA synthetase